MILCVTSSRREVLIGTLLIVSLLMPASKAIRLDLASQGRGEALKLLERRDTSRTQNEYSWLCPSVTCQPVSDDCETVESIIYTYPVLRRDPSTGERRQVTISCESCEYCLDPPFAKRSSPAEGSRKHVNASEGCQAVTCSPLPDTCERILLCDVTVGKERCRRCPACFDGTIIDTKIANSKF